MAVPVVICLVLVPGKLPENVAERRKNMSNVLKIVWLCLKTKTRLSLRNSRPSKIFIVIKQNNCLSFGPRLLWTLIKAWEEAILQIAIWTWETDTWGPCGTQFCLVFSDWCGRYSKFCHSLHTLLSFLMACKWLFRLHFLLLLFAGKLLKNVDVGRKNT